MTLTLQAVREIVREIDCRHPSGFAINFEIVTKNDELCPSIWFLRAFAWLPDTTAPESQSWNAPATKQPGRKWYISPFMTEGEVVQTALMAALAFEEHEVREAFTYCGRPLYGPHININAQLHIATTIQKRDEPVDLRND